MRAGEVRPRAKSRTSSRTVACYTSPPTFPVTAAQALAAGQAPLIAVIPVSVLA
jgi:hypothetical protein